MSLVINPRPNPSPNPSPKRRGELLQQIPLFFPPFPFREGAGVR